MKIRKMNILLGIALFYGITSVSAKAAESVPGFPRTILVYDDAIRPPVVATLSDIHIQNFDLMSFKKIKDEKGNHYCDLSLKPKNGIAMTAQFRSADGLVEGTLGKLVIRQPNYIPDGDCRQDWLRKPIAAFALVYTCETKLSNAHIQFLFQDETCKEGQGYGSNGYFSPLESCAITEWQ